MRKIRNLMRRLIREERGSNAVEYVLILALVSLVIVVAATTLGTSLQAKFNEAASDVATAGTGGGTPPP